MVMFAFSGLCCVNLSASQIVLKCPWDQNDRDQRWYQRFPTADMPMKIPRNRDFRQWTFRRSFVLTGPIIFVQHRLGQKVKGHTVDHKIFVAYDRKSDVWISHKVFFFVSEYRKESELPHRVFEKILWKFSKGKVMSMGRWGSHNRKMWEWGK